MRSRFSKDDIKDQAYQAREYVKTKAIDLKEQINKEGVAATVQAQLQPAIDLVKEKVGELTSSGSSTDATPVRRGGPQIKQTGILSAEQQANLQRGVQDLQEKAVDISNEAYSRMRQVKQVIRKNRLQTPAFILGTLLTLWIGLTVIRLTTRQTKPEFDIHSQEASTSWLKYHAGDFRGKMIDMKESLTDRAASFLSNHDFDALKTKTIDYREIGMKKLGLTEPTWSEWAWAKLTGRPITWKDRVEHVVDLTKQGIQRPDILTRLGLKHQPTLNEKASGMADSIHGKASGLADSVSGKVSGLADSLSGKASGLADSAAGLVDSVSGKASHLADSLKAQIPDSLHSHMHSFRDAVDPTPSSIDVLKAKVQAGVDSLKEHLPHSADELAALTKAKLGAATEIDRPSSTLDDLRSKAEYVKNRAVHGTQEAIHKAQDAAQRAADELRYTVGK